VEDIHGTLTRSELLRKLEVVAGTVSDEEPMMVLALAIEGLRALDDCGQWNRRDAVIERIGRVLSRRVRSDDLVGRFSDDRFIVVLRRLDSRLGTLVAEKLLHTLRSEVLDEWSAALPAGRGDDAPHTELRIRAGLASSRAAGIATMPASESWEAPT